MMLLQKEIEKGQTLLIVVLVMVVSLTIGLSIASKTITNLRTSTEEADSAKALSAAETGIAQQLQKLKSGTQVGNGSVQFGTNFNAGFTSVGGTTSFLVNAGNVIPQDEGADVWLIDHDDSGNLIFSPQWNGTLAIYWGDGSGDCNPNSALPKPALEVITITNTQIIPITTRYGYDPCGGTRSPSNNFASPTSSPLGGVVVSGKTFYYFAVINGLDGVTNGLLVRIIPLYTNTVLGVQGSVALPQQGSIITSTGTSSVNVKRKISVVANYYSLPSEFFTYGLFVPR